MTVSAKKNLNIIIDDQALSKSINSNVSSQYQVNFFQGVDACLSASENEDVALVLCDYKLLGENQAEKLAQLKAAFPNARVLIIGDHCSSELQITVLKQGARGYFDYSSSVDNLSTAIRCVLMGEVWIERHVISGLIDALSQTPQITEQQQQALDSLSPKEHQVAELVSHGATNKKIAIEMEITERTVKSHLTAIFQKMGIRDRLSLAIFFRDLR